MRKPSEAKVNKDLCIIEKAFKTIKAVAKRNKFVNPADLDEIAKDISDWVIEPMCLSVVADY
jgi:uncharacterized membrane protein